MLIKLIMRLRRQPASHRNHLALAVAGSFTTVIALVWLTVQIGSLSNMKIDTTANTGAPILSGFVNELQDRVSKVSEISEVWRDVTTFNTESITPSHDTDIEISSLTASTTILITSTSSVLSTERATATIVRIATTSPVRESSISD